MFIHTRLPCLLRAYFSEFFTENQKSQVQLGKHSSTKLLQHDRYSWGREPLPQLQTHSWELSTRWPHAMRKSKWKIHRSTKINKSHPHRHSSGKVIKAKSTSSSLAIAPQIPLGPETGSPYCPSTPRAESIFITLPSFLTARSGK